MSASDDVGRLLEVEDPTFDDVMACVFGVGEREVRTYLALLDRPGSTVEELAGALSRDRSNVNRALSRLLDLDLARRERRLLDPGGYVYQYTATSLPATKARLHASLDAWAERVHERIEGFADHVAAIESQEGPDDGDGRRTV